MTKLKLVEPLDLSSTKALSPLNFLFILFFLSLSFIHFLSFFRFLNFEHFSVVYMSDVEIWLNSFR